MWKLLSVIVAGAALAAVGVACAGAEPTPTPTPTAAPTRTVVSAPTPTPTGAVATPTATAAPKRGGVLRLREAGLPPSFYYHQMTGDLGQIIPSYNGIIGQDPLDPTSQKIVPELAERWEVSKDGLTITFFLRQGVKFHDGTPLTADDVVYNLELVRNPPQGFPSPRKGLFDAVAAVERGDDKTVAIKLKRVSNSIMELLASGWIQIAPKHVIEQNVLKALDKVQVGTGPFRFKEFTPEGIVKHERNTEYFRPGLPYLDGIEAIPIADIDAYVAAAYTGQIDTSGLSKKSLSRSTLQRIEKERPDLLRLAYAPTKCYEFLSLNAKMAPFTDQRVRTALQDALDRTELNKTSGTLAIPGGGMHHPASMWALPKEELAKMPGFGPDIKARRERARQLLKDAGVGPGTEIMLSAKSTKPLMVELVELIQLQWQEALGIQVKARLYPSAEFDSIEQKFGLPAYVEAMCVQGFDPDFFGPIYITGGSRNYINMSEPRADELYQRQSTMLDVQERQKVGWELEKAVLQYAAHTPVWWKKEPLLSLPYVKNLVNPVDQFSSVARREVVWLDK